MSETAIRFLGDLQRLTIEPGDKFVLMANETFDPKQREMLAEVWREFAGPDVRLLLLDNGMKLGVLNKSGAAA